MAAGQVAVYSGGKISKTGSGENATIEGNLVVEGNLTVVESSTAVTVEDINVEQAEITLNYSTGDSSASANGAGIRIQDAVDSSNDATILWDGTNDEFDFSHAVNITGNLSVSGSIDGIADLASTVTANTAKVTNATHTGDVTGSGALTIANDAVSYAKIQNVAGNNVLLGNDDGAGSAVQELSATAVRTLLNVEDGADVTDAANVTAAGALMDTECASLGDVKALDQSVISGASPTFSTANMTDASDKRFMTDAQETKLDAIEAAADVTDATNVAAAGAVMSSLIDAKADLIIGSLDNTVARLAIGTDTHVLTANSSAGAGIEWAAIPSAGSSPTYESTDGQFINAGFQNGEAITAGKAVCFSVTGGDNQLYHAVNTDANKDTVIGVAASNAAYSAATAANLKFKVMGNHGNIDLTDANRKTMKFNVAHAGDNTQKYYVLEAQNGADDSSWSGTGASNDPYTWGIQVGNSRSVDAVLGSIRTALSASISGDTGLADNFTVGAIQDDGSDRVFFLTADNAGAAYNFSSADATAEQWQDSSNGMESQFEKTAGANEVTNTVKVLLPGSVYQGNTSGLTKGTECYLGAAGAIQDSAPTTGAVIRVGFVASVHGSTGAILVMPQYIMDN